MTTFYYDCFNRCRRQVRNYCASYRRVSSGILARFKLKKSKRVDICLEPEAQNTGRHPNEDPFPTPIGDTEVFRGELVPWSNTTTQLHAGTSSQGRWSVVSLMQSSQRPPLSSDLCSSIVYLNTEFNNGIPEGRLVKSIRSTYFGPAGFEEHYVPYRTASEVSEINFWKNMRMK